jgi:hypothetical protein
MCKGLIGETMSLFKFCFIVGLLLKLRNEIAKKNAFLLKKKIVKRKQKKIHSVTF